MDIRKHAEVATDIIEFLQQTYKCDVTDQVAALKTAATMLENDMTAKTSAALIARAFTNN